MGKLRGKVVKSGDNGMISYKNADGVKTEIPYDQPLSAELGIAMGTRVSFDVVLVNNSNMAVAVAPINNGTVGKLDPIKGIGSVLETESQIEYPFQQNYTAESLIVVGSNVKYTLVWSNNVLSAAALSLIP